MNTVILFDFGSTFTKATVVSLNEKKVIFTTKTPSTVNTNAKHGLDKCCEDIKKIIGESELAKARKFATSSASGGLRMIVIGLTPNLSLLAGKNAALSAGAKLLNTFSGLLTDADVKQIENSNSEIILLCGGYEKGNVSAVLHNVNMLSKSNIRVPVIYAGNSTIAKKAKMILKSNQKECFTSNNIIPNVGEIDSKLTESIIRNIFMQRITNMKGLDKVIKDLDDVLIPTPASVLEAGELLSKGYKNISGLGNIMILDVGGATTDIHSYGESTPFEGARMIGSPEPYAKRTVEGDLGMRESAKMVIDEIGWSVASNDLGIDEEELMKSVHQRVQNTKILPQDDSVTEELESRIDQQIARYAVRIAARRHAGRIEYVHSKVCDRVQKGKNLSDVNTIIGTGAEIINSRNAREILQEVFLNDKDRKLNILLPEKARTLIDKDYIFYAAGLLKYIDPEAALSIMHNSLKEV